MKPVMIAGIVLIVLGILALAFQGLTYTKREKTVDIGPIEITKEKKKHVPLPPIAGAAAVIAGTALVIGGNRKT